MRVGLALTAVRALRRRLVVGHQDEHAGQGVITTMVFVVVIALSASLLITIVGPLPCVDAARDLFAEHGYATTSCDDILILLAAATHPSPAPGHQPHDEYT